MAKKTKKTISSAKKSPDDEPKTSTVSAAEKKSSTSSKKEEIKTTKATKSSKSSSGKKTSSGESKSTKVGAGKKGVTKKSTKTTKVATTKTAKKTKSSGKTELTQEKQASVSSEERQGVNPQKNNAMERSSLRKSDQDEATQKEIELILKPRKGKKLKGLSIPSPRQSAFAIFFVGWITLMLDQLSKLAALIFVQPRQTIQAGVVSLRYIENTGAAFGTFGSATYYLTLISGAFVAATVLVLLGVTLFPQSTLGKAIYRYTSSFLGSLSVGLVLGGAAGNLIDRAIRNYVVDFIDLRVWPVFNIADCCIVLGVVGIIWVLMKQQE